jgi:hypothetical protein
MDFRPTVGSTEKRGVRATPTMPSSARELAVLSRWFLPAAFSLALVDNKDSKSNIRFKRERTAHENRK